MTPERAKVLIVDDAFLLRKVLRALMHRVGCTDIDEACNGAEALQLIEMRDYDLVLTDWNMPHVSGLELLKTIRHGTSRHHTAVVLISGEVTQRRRVEAIDCGANAFIAKPFVASALCDELSKIVSELPSEQPKARVSEEAQVPL
jgi:two-component system chemotaxis response regulator CheY